VAVVTRRHFDDVPAQGTGFISKRREKGSGGVILRGTLYERGRQAALLVGGKINRAFETAQSEVAEPVANEIAGVAWLQAPKVELTFSCRQTPAVSMLTRCVAEIIDDSSGKQIQCALPMIGNKSIDKDQARDLVGIGLGYAADDHAGIAMSDEDHFTPAFRDCARNVLYMLVEGNGVR